MFGYIKQILVIAAAVVLGLAVYNLRQNNG